MKPVLIAGISIVNLALISYSVAIFLQNKHRIFSKRVMTFLTIGVIFDIIATVCMVIGSAEGAMTLHGIIGYSSLAGMLTDTVLSYKNVKENGINAKVSARFHAGSKSAYLYWVLAYITGALIIALRHKS
jgi:hypothetical protein